MLQAEAGLQEWDAVDPADQALEERHQPQRSEASQPGTHRNAFSLFQEQIQYLLRAYGPLPWDTSFYQAQAPGDV